LSASSASQRAIVEADASQTPRSTTSRCSSAREKRESGTPCVRGNAQAIAFTSAICSGGKTARAARPRSILEPCKPLIVEASSPASDDLRRRLQPTGDLDVRQPLSRVQDHLRPLRCGRAGQEEQPGWVLHLGGECVLIGLRVGEGVEERVVCVCRIDFDLDRRALTLVRDRDVDLVGRRAPRGSGEFGRCDSGRHV
jgi:hypothetical protein